MIALGSVVTWSDHCKRLEILQVFKVENDAKPTGDGGSNVCYRGGFPEWPGFRFVKPWPNGSPNSSQLEPRAKSKLASAGVQTIPPSRASLQETIQFSEYDRV